MAVPGSGAIHMKGLHNEKNEDNYDASTTPSGKVTMKDLVSGGNTGGSSVSYDTTNTDSSSYPNTTEPHAFNEWYSYDHDAAAAGLSGWMAEDFYGDYQSWSLTSRDSFSTTAFQDTNNAINQDYGSNTTTTRPNWTLSGDANDNSSHLLTMKNSGTSNSNWHNGIRTRKRNASDDLGISIMNQSINFMFRLNMVGGNKDMFLMFDFDTNEASSFGNAQNYIALQWRDNSDSTYARKTTLRKKISGTLTNPVDTSFGSGVSYNQFSLNQFQTCVVSMKVTAYYTTTVRAYMSTTDGTIGSRWHSASISSPSFSYLRGVNLFTVRSGNSSTECQCQYITSWTEQGFPDD